MESSLQFELGLLYLGVKFGGLGGVRVGDNDALSMLSFSLPLL